MASTTLSIIGPSTLSSAQITNWCAANGHRAKYVSTAIGGIPNVSIGDLANMYVAEGQVVGVRGDVAFAQACEETGYFSAPGAAQQLRQNNFAGIAVYSSSAAGDGFATPLLGVRAHIQLLYRVVFGNRQQVPGGNVIAPDWAGKTATTWGGLSGNWASDPSYGQQIIDIYNSMLGGKNPAESVPTFDGSGTAFPARLQKYIPQAATIPGVDRSRKATAALDPTEWLFPYNFHGQHIIKHVSTESTVDLTVGQVPEVNLTVIDPAFEVFDSLYPMINQTEGQIGLLARWRGEVLALAEVQATTLNGVPATILCMRSAVFTWMQVQRHQNSYPGSATEWIRDRVAEYNSQLPKDFPPATFMAETTAPRGANPVNMDRPWVQWLSYYDYAQLLAIQEGFWLWETNGGVFFGEPPWAYRNTSTVSVGWPGLDRHPTYDRSSVDVEVIDVPVILRSNVLFTGDTMTLQLPRDVGEQIRCGQAISMAGIRSVSNTKWLVQEVTFAFDGGQTPVQVQCNQAHVLRGTEPGGKTPPSPTSDPTGRAPYAPPIPVTSSVRQFLQAAMSQAGDAYVFGGEIAGVEMDCSGLVQYACAQCGIDFPRTTYEQYPYLQAHNALISVQDAEHIPGALLYGPGSDPGPNGLPGHVMISLGNGNIFGATRPGVNVGVFPGDFSQFTSGALIPGLDYKPVTPKHNGPPAGTPYNPIPGVG